MTIQETIIKIVNESPAIKGVDLVVEVMQEIPISERQNADVPGEIEKLVKLGKIIEIEYILPTENDRIKTIYFPLGTSIRRTY